MTNLEWIHSLSIDEVLSFFGGYTSKCHMCGYKGTCTDNTAKCYRFPIGLNIWLMQEHKHVPEIKPCPVCEGEMSIRWQHDGCYLVCEDCGMHFGIDTDKAEQGIIEGDYAEEEALIDDWNRRADGGEA